MLTLSEEREGGALSEALTRSAMEKVRNTIFGYDSRHMIITNIIIVDPERISNSPDQDMSPGPPSVNTSESSSSGLPPAGALMTPVTFAPGFYGQYTMPATGRSGEAPPTYFPQFYIAQPPPPPLNPDGSIQAAYPHPQFYPAFVPFGGGYAPYMVQGPNGQLVPSYAMYARPPSAENPSAPIVTSRAEQVAAEEEEEPGDPSA